MYKSKWYIDKFA